MSRIFETATEIVGWVQIVLSLLLIGGIIGWILYYNISGVLGVIIGFALPLLGLILDIRWANKSYKGKGTVHLISRVSAYPELDKEKDNSTKSWRVFCFVNCFNIPIPITIGISNGEFT